MNRINITVIGGEPRAVALRDPYADLEKVRQEEVERTRHWNSVEAGTFLKPALKPSK